MQATCLTNNLNKAVQTALRAINSKPSTPIFSGLHIIAKDDKLEIQGMDTNMAISCTIPAAVTIPGDMVVSAKYAAELIRNLTGDAVIISKNTENKTMKLESNQAEFKLLLMNEDDYPKFPIFKGEQQIVIPDIEIKNLIKKTIYACSSDDARPLFTGIYIELKDNQLTFVGTNTHRLAIKSLPFPTEKNMSLIIPSKVLAEISRNLINDEPQKVTISLLKNQVMINVDDTVIISRLIEGSFPDYHRVIPPAFKITAIVNIEKLQGAVKRVSLFSTEGDYNIVKMSVGNNSITLTSSSPELGMGKEIIDCITSGEQLNVAFNSKYLLDILNNLDSDEVTLSMNSSLSPVCITSENEPGYIYIVTPVRVVF